MEKFCSNGKRGIIYANLKRYEKVHCFFDIEVINIYAVGSL